MQQRKLSLTTTCNAIIYKIYATFGREERSRVDENKMDEWKLVRNKVEIKGAWLKRNREEMRREMSGNR